MRPAIGSGEYRAFLLRLWREPSAGRRYRCSLENPETGQRRGFDSVEGLLAFLAALAAAEEETEAAAEGPEPEGSGGGGEGAPPAAGRSR